MKNLLIITLALLLASCSPSEEKSTQLSEAQQERIIVLGASVGEMVYALGKGDTVVARDLSCQYPRELAAKPDVGYYRALSTEGILSLNPTAILTTSEAGPPNVIAQLQASEIPLLILPAENTVESLKQNLQTVGALLGAAKQADQLITQLDQSLGRISPPEQPHRVLFLLSPPGSGRYMAAGTGTAADAMITLAGGENLFGDIPGYKPVSAETLAGRQPDVVLVASMGARGQKPAPEDLAKQFPFLQNSPAAEHNRFATLDIGRILSFGPHTGERAVELHQLIYPSL